MTRFKVKLDYTDEVCFDYIPVSLEENWVIPSGPEALVGCMDLREQRISCFEGIELRASFF